MPHFADYVTNVSTGTVADTFLTYIGLLAADTAGHRARLRRLSVGVSDDSPTDSAIAIQVVRVNDVSGSGSGTDSASTTEAKKDPNSVANNVAGRNGYSAEPTYDDILWHLDLNARGSIVVEWDELDAPTIQRDQLLAIRIAPRDTTAKACSVSVEWEEF